MASTLIVDTVTKLATAWGQDVDNAVYNYLSGVAGTNTITATGPVGLAAYASGLTFRFLPAVTNTGATTINITGTGALGARNIFYNGAALSGGELVAGTPAVIIDDGTRFHLVSYPLQRILIKRKTADESVTSSTVLQDDNHLTFTIAASEEWLASFWINVGAAAHTTGLKVAVTAPAGSTLDATGAFFASAEIGYGRTTTSGTAFISTAITQLADDVTVKVDLWVLNGATPGSITLQWAQGTSSGTALTFRKGSSMTAVRVA